MGRPSTFHTRLFKRRLHIPAINLSFISDSQQYLWCDEKKSKDYYLLLVTEKAHKGKSDFNLSDDNLREFFLFPHSIALESYVEAFQYKVLHNILYTNTKLFKIGFRTDDVCTFCEAEPETLYHILYQCPYSRRFWKDFESYWCRLSNQQVRLSLQNVMFGIVFKQCPSTKLLNYFIVVGKLFFSDCRSFKFIKSSKKLLTMNSACK